MFGVGVLNYQYDGTSGVPGRAQWRNCMNKTYKVLFNRVRGVATAVSEIASSHQARKKATTVAVAVAMGVMAGSAMATDIVISSSGVEPPTYVKDDPGTGVKAGVSVKDNTAALSSNVTSIKTVGDVSDNVYGIYSQSGGSGSITATSITGGINLITTGQYSVYGISFESSGTSTLGTGSTTGVGNIEVQSVIGANGIYAKNGTNTVNFVSGSSITAKSSGDTVYGIAFGSADSSATGTTTISGLGSITATNTRTAFKINNYAYGIYSKNGNAAWAKAGDPKFSVEFATGGEGGGTINAYSATVPSYGILFDEGSTGTSTITGVKTITAGTNTSTGTAIGIQACAGNNTVTFKGTQDNPSSITAASSVQAIGIGYNSSSGTTSITDLGSITAKSESLSKNGAYGIQSQNQNGASAAPTFSIAFAGAGSFINVYSATGANYGIQFCLVGTSQSQRGTSLITQDRKSVV